MAYPDLYSDESVVLNTQNIKVKSVSFEAVLTTRRLILVDSKKHLIAPQEILLATLRDIEVGENAIRDPTIMLSIITNSGATRQMILTFSKTSGGERKRECDEWAKVLRQHTSSTFQHPIMPDIAKHEDSSPANAEPAHSRMEMTSIPSVPSPKKKIEIAEWPFFLTVGDDFQDLLEQMVKSVISRFGRLTRQGDGVAIGLGDLKDWNAFCSEFKERKEKIARYFNVKNNFFVAPTGQGWIISYVKGEN